MLVVEENRHSGILENLSDTKNLRKGKFADGTKRTGRWHHDKSQNEHGPTDEKSNHIVVYDKPRKLSLIILKNWLSKHRADC